MVVSKVEPGFGDEIARWNFTCKAFDDDIWVEVFDEVDDELDIIFESEEMKISGVGEVFVSHFCVFEYLKLVKFHCSERQLRDYVSCVKHHVASFSGESEDEMTATMKTIVVNKFNGVASCGEGVAAVDAKKSLVVDGLHSEFD